jgi:hypothetical protein
MIECNYNSLSFLLVEKCSCDTLELGVKVGATPESIDACQSKAKSQILLVVPLPHGEDSVSRHQKDTAEQTPTSGSKTMTALARPKSNGVSSNARRWSWPRSLYVHQHVLCFVSRTKRTKAQRASTYQDSPESWSPE